MRRIARAARDIIRLTFARDTLGEVGGSTPGRARHTARELLRAVVAIEPLPLDPAAPSRPRHSWLAMLLRPEALPRDPVAPERPRTHLGLRSLLAPEPLPLDPVPPAPRRPSRVAALFAPESLDDQ